MTHFKPYPMILMISILYGLVFFSVSADEFSDLMGDVPLVAGLQEDINQRLVFDKPEGRIVETTAFGSVAINGVWDFYIVTLPELGWQNIESNKNKNSLLFSREGESLEIKFLKLKTVLEVKFSIYPSSH